ncbi:hypothetical protein SDC9_203461 [bioreactor metagenome]|uniref:Uncharacterized protein n=1 Tax=bioreactor metagenome TaxID=1076179 RepID=A0A645IXB5_9ZZZZ
MHRVAAFECERDNRVSCFVIGGDALVDLGDHTAALFGAHLHAGYRFFKLRHANCLFAAARGENRRLVEHVFQISAGKAGRALCQNGKLHLFGQRLIARVYL